MFLMWLIYSFKMLFAYMTSPKPSLLTVTTSSLTTSDALYASIWTLRYSIEAGAIHRRTCKKKSGEPDIGEYSEES